MTKPCPTCGHDPEVDITLSVEPNTVWVLRFDWGDDDATWVFSSLEKAAKKREWLAVKYWDDDIDDHEFKPADPEAIADAYWEIMAYNDPPQFCTINEVDLE